MGPTQKEMEAARELVGKKAPLEETGIKEGAGVKLPGLRSLRAHTTLAEDLTLVPSSHVRKLQRNQHFWSPWIPALIYIFKIKLK